jgi:hypothetical protein
MAMLQGDPNANQMNALFRRIQVLEEFLKSRSTVDDLPGVRIPYDLVTSASVAANTTKVTDTQQVSDAGPLIVTELIGAWKRTSTGFFGLISSINDLSTTTADPLDGAYNLTDSGSGQMLSNADVPTVALFSNDRPAYLATAWHIKKNSSVRMEMTPAIAPAGAGTFYLILRGYRILTTVSAL